MNVVDGDNDGAVQEEYFLYTGRDDEVVPEDVTHVRIHSSVRKIKNNAFFCHGLPVLVAVIFNEELEEIGMRAFGNCTSLERIVVPNTVKTIKAGAFGTCFGLTTVTLSEGLEEIGDEAFEFCESLEEIVIPNTVKAIHRLAFSMCMGLTNVTLGEGLEEIGDMAFENCALQRIVIPPSVKAINQYAFCGCSWLTAVTLSDGLEEIGDAAFGYCALLQRIVIPSTVREIHDRSFRRCSSLTNVIFSDEIEEFVSCEAMRDWWNRGIHKNSLRTYCLLVKYDIPERLGLVRVRRWQMNIYKMLSLIPTIHPRGMNEYFVFIESNLSTYESLKDSPALLELAIWKSVITGHIHGQNSDRVVAKRAKQCHNHLNTKAQCRIDSMAMVTIIVPYVFLFLTDGDDGSDIVIDNYSDSGDSNDGNDSDDDSDRDSEEHEDDDNNDRGGDNSDDENGDNDADNYD